MDYQDRSGSLWIAELEGFELDEDTHNRRIEGQVIIVITQLMTHPCFITTSKNVYRLEIKPQIETTDTAYSRQVCFFNHAKRQVR